MLNRRTFVQAGVAAWSVSLMGGPGSAWSAAAGSNRIDFYKVLFDRQHPAARNFGGAAEAAGLTVQAIDRDVTALWYDDLYHRWRRGPAAIAGLTPVPVAFCLQLLGQDAGMRMVFRAQHTPLGDGRIEHRLSGPRTVLEGAAVLDGGTDWSPGAARLVAACPAGRSDRSTRVLTSDCPAGSAFQEPLVSWVITPVSRA
jgi:hypothetical protein